MVLENENKLNQWHEVLQQQGFGHSEAQKTLIVVLSTATSPMSAEEIREETQRIRPETGRATVYRFVDKLTSLGLLRRVHGYRNCNTYIPALNSHQIVLICTYCDTVSYLKTDLLCQMRKAIENTDTEFAEHHITHYHLQLLGICTDCQTNHL